MVGEIRRENSTNLEKGQFWTVFELPKEKDIPTYKEKASSSWQIPRNSTTHGNGHKLLQLYPTCEIRWWWLQLHEAAHFTSSPPNNWLLTSKKSLHPEGIGSSPSSVTATTRHQPSIARLISRTISKDEIVSSGNYKNCLLGNFILFDQIICGQSNSENQPGFSLSQSSDNLSHHFIHRNRNLSSSEIHRDSLNSARFSVESGFIYSKYFKLSASFYPSSQQTNQIVCDFWSSRIGFSNRLKAHQTFRHSVIFRFKQGYFLLPSLSLIITNYIKFLTIYSSEFNNLSKVYCGLLSENHELNIRQVLPINPLLLSLILILNLLN